MSHPTLEQVLAAVESLGEMLSAHQAEETKRYETINGTLKLLIEDKREQAHRLTILEGRVGRLEAAE